MIVLKMLAQYNNDFNWDMDKMVVWFFWNPKLHNLSLILVKIYRRVVSGNKSNSRHSASLCIILIDQILFGVPEA